ncbi:hypothetical protein CLAFUW4_20078 [Fulvia fulva]|uniref:Extracellular protein 17 n=1 Tax=Passalora fulva TaxID=5499 RepID=A0A1P8YXI7_PASFU|nr:uncharacterized protein CLAFUR5_20078 [Fulvia fulva]AQA29222.1 extracellular protein 17 [Fulvia fulva]KAK4613652.1 hypothetical protein CLAFUR4_20078 [Fulvia fulva]KAK4615268.1 hypothetical protein CLAFUR0_20078 [Fulvia fulva]WMI38999.1 hypothetical protein CLAFUR5_20078 [Fulvia fulva]WPV20442.1 hypothetical protein CLAFUW4_20078 [Fulvia fulva]
MWHARLLSLGLALVTLLKPTAGECYSSAECSNDDSRCGLDYNGQVQKGACWKLIDGGDGCCY